MRLATPAQTSTPPLQWSPAGGRGAHRLPTDAPIAVGSAKLRYSPGWGDPAYEFSGGIAQAVGGAELFLETGGAHDAEQVLAGLRVALEGVPETLLANIRQIRVLRGQDAGYDRYFERSYGIPGFQAVAAGGGGTITFFGGRPYSVGTLFHELAHNLPVSGWGGAVKADDATIATLGRQGTLTATEFEHIPDAVRRARWTPRLAPGALTPYGASATGEDIAEGLQMLLKERHFGAAFARLTTADGTSRPLTFSEAYPARTAVLERAARFDLNGDGVVGG